MRLPEELLEAIQHEFETARATQGDLARASADLTRRYRAGAEFAGAKFKAPLAGAITSNLHRAAYLATRMPATYAACAHVFAEISRLAPHAEITSVLDLGAGPGTAVFAAAQIFPALRHAQLVESSGDWIGVGKSLMAGCRQFALQQARWIQHDLRTEFEVPAHDLAVISYALGELPQTSRQALVKRAWNWASQFVAVIEPGTTRGFAAICEARADLIAQGGNILAPCPHHDACPMAGTRDWCHFAERLERTPEHRRLKHGALGYEDEKFSYVVASRQNIQQVSARIVRHPKKLDGHVQLSLCSKNGLQTRTVARSAKENYRLARKASWGDAWEE
jgi:ribosomal protein RSM22 (predicted rRNA methylase)